MRDHLFDLVYDAKTRLSPVESRYRVIFEVPENEGSALDVLIPDPNWMAAALAGGILPPVETYIEDALKRVAWCAVNDPKHFMWELVGGATHPYAAPVGPMTEEEAVEYLIKKDLPLSVWIDHETANRPRFKIVYTEMVPSDRSYREAWEYAE